MSDVKLSPKAKKIKKGLYRHYKNNNYEVLGVVVHSETLEEHVLYKALYGGRLTWVRPLAMFTETVIVEGKKIPRFKYVGSSKKSK